MQDGPNSVSINVFFIAVVERVSVLTAFRFLVSHWFRPTTLSNKTTHLRCLGSFGAFSGWERVTLRFLLVFWTDFQTIPKIQTRRSLEFRISRLREYARIPQGRGGRSPPPGGSSAFFKQHSRNSKFEWSPFLDFLDLLEICSKLGIGGTDNNRNRSDRNHGF